MRTSFLIDEELFKKISELCVAADLKREAFFRKAFKAALQMDQDKFLEENSSLNKEKSRAVVNLPDELINDIDIYCRNIDQKINRSDFFRIASTHYYFYLS